jgi:hypothetical protein
MDLLEKDYRYPRVLANLIVDHLIVHVNVGDILEAKDAFSYHYQGEHVDLLATLLLSSGCKQQTTNNKTTTYTSITHNTTQTSHSVDS